MYNLVQVFKHFKVENNADIINSQQYQAGVSIFVKCDESMEIVEKWFSLTQTHPEYFIGDDRFCDLIRDTQIVFISYIFYLDILANNHFLKNEQFYFF